MIMFNENTYAYNGFFALGTGFREFLSVAFGAYWASITFIECNGCDWFFANQAHEMVWMP